MTDDTAEILVVEDDDNVRDALAALLEAKGYRVIGAENGRTALDCLQHATVHLILLDLFMPVMNGWAFREEQVKDERLATIPVVVISADSAAAAFAVSPGVVAVMTKPVEFNQLLNVVEQHC